MKATGCEWAYHQQVYGLTARGEAEDRDVRRVTAKAADIFMYPVQCGDHVEQPEVGAAVGKRVMRHETKRSEAIVHRHDHHLFSGEHFAGKSTRTRAKTAAMNPYHDWESLRAIKIRCPDIQEQAVLAGLGGRGLCWCGLQAGGAVLGSPDWIGGLARSLRRLPAQATCRRCGVTDASERENAVPFRVADEASRGGFGNWRRAAQ